MSNSSNNSIQTVNPFSEEPISQFVYISNIELEKKVKACHEAFLEWRLVSLEKRASIISAIGETLRKHQSDLASLMTAEMGKLLKQSNQEIELCAKICDYTAKNGPKELSNEDRDLPDGEKGIIAYAPLGVVYGIQPWNYPAYQVIRYAIAGLMAGNGILLKHASNVTGTGQFLEKIMIEAGLPKNLFTVLIIDHDQSDEVIKNDYVQGVTFTGSAEAGKTIGKKAAVELKKSVLELGSNDAYIVLEDADIELAIEMSVKGRIYNNGETCIAAKRFIVVEKIYKDFKKAFVDAMKELKTGDPTNNETDLGPIARKDLREKINNQVQQSVEKGATILCGGKIPDGKGFFYPATVLEKVEPGQPAYDDEIFGPIASLIKAKDEEDAMRIANDSRFGLGGGIFSKNEKHVSELAQKYFDTGMVFINTFGLAKPNMPFGGVKNSGYGREHGGFGLKEFVNVKSIVIG